MKKNRIYLDHNATTPIDPRVQKAIIEEFSKGPDNPSSMHFYGQEAKKSLIKARQTVAQFLAVKPSEIFFTGGGTESMNLLIQGFLPPPPCHIIGSNLDHPCILETLKELEKLGYSVTYLSPGLYGAPKPEEIKAAIGANTQLIALTAVNSETGVKLDIDSAASIAKKAGIPLILDGVALLGKERFKIPEGVIGMGFSAHKIHGPLGVGFIFSRSGWKPRPLFFGGGQESGIRPGTENLPGIIGLAKAVSILEEEIDNGARHMASLKERFESKLREKIPSLSINGSGPRICNTSNICFPNIDAESLLIHLDMQGIAASHASACSAGMLETSRVLLNMGIPRKEAASSLRFSFSRMNSVEEIDEAVQIISQIICAAS